MYDITSWHYFMSMIRRMALYGDIRIELTKLTHYIRRIGIPNIPNS